MGRGGGRREAEWWWPTTGLVICSAKDWEWWHCGHRHKAGMPPSLLEPEGFPVPASRGLRALDESWALRNLQSLDISYRAACTKRQLR